MRRAVFAFPAAPPAWDEPGGQVVRIIDPLGAAIAWFTTGQGVNCVGFAVRRPDGSAADWTHVIRAHAPDDPGCPVVLCLPEPGSTNPAPEWTGNAGDHAWQLVERDPTMVVLETMFSVGNVASGRHVRPGGIRLRLLASLENATLLLRISARNDGPETVSIGLGLSPRFPGNPFGERSPSGLGQRSDPSTPAPLAACGPASGYPHHQPKGAGTGNVLAGQPRPTLLMGIGDRGTGIEITPESGTRITAVTTARDQAGVSLTLRNTSLDAGLVRLLPGASIAVGATIGVRFSEPADGRKA